MDASTLFQFANLAAVIGWLALLLALFWTAGRERALTVSGLIVPALFAAAYVAIIARGMTLAGGTGGTDFSTLEGIKRLFSEDFALLAGWLHYLAFDLFVGTWIARDGLARRANRLALIPVLFLTFMFGPAGFLSWLALRGLWKPQPSAT